MDILRFREAFSALVAVTIAVCAFPGAASAVTDQDSSSFITQSEFSWEPDAMSGSYSYPLPFTLPPGRSGMQPSLALTYNSGSSDVASIVGYGWSMSIPSIERIARHGTDNLYTNHEFTSVLSGELEDITLTDATHGTFGAKIDDGSYLTYTYDTTETWTVTDKRGVTYTFGASAASRVADPADATHVFRWMIDSIEDANGNTVTFTYTSDGNQLYPSSINYTGNGSTPGIFDVQFVLEARTDAATSYASGFAVETAYRIDRVDVEENGTVVRSYDLAYTVGDNGTRSLLASVTESGTDSGVTITSPATTFSYESGALTWTESEAYTLPVAIANTGSGSLGIYVFDVNGDALPDVVKGRDTDRVVYINNGDGTWTEDTSITLPIAFASSIGRDMGVRAVDVNGDGFMDLLWSRHDSTGVQESASYINNGDGTGWTLDTTLVIPIAFTSDGGLDYGVRIFDVNGDGMQDFVKSRAPDPSSVYINNGDGTGWTEDTSYGAVPVYFAKSTGRENGVRIFDANGDGLLDLVYASNTSTSSIDAVYINNGHGWTEDASISVPLMFALDSGADAGVRDMDVNADGLTDLVYSRHDAMGTHGYSAWLNDGSGWTQATGVTPPLAFTNDGGIDYGMRIVDLNADGIDDFLKSRDEGYGNAEYFYTLDAGYADMLSEIATARGATTSVVYTTSVADNADVPFALRVVSSVTTDDGVGNTATASYAYTDGDYYYADEYDRRFAGFGTLTTTDAVGNLTVTSYHQGNTTDTAHGESTDDISKLGRQYREETYNSSGVLYRTQIDSWTNVDIGSARDLVYVSQSLELLYDGDSDHRDKATTFTYDTATGNMSERIDYGLGTGTDAGAFTDTGTDLARTSYTYAAWTTGGTSSYPTAEILRDSSSNRWRHTRWFYDGQAFGYLTTGNTTIVSQWVVGTTSLDTTYTYDAYGLVATQTDPRGMTTTYTPDADSLYPATVTDELGHAVSYVYDYSSGQIAQTTNMNGDITQTDYDGLDRPVTVWQPDPDAPTTLVEKTAYSYDDTRMPTSVQQTEYLDATLTRETYTYFDGFGRVVQTRKEAEDANTYAVTDIRYDELGRVEQTSLPYSATDSAYAAATTDTTLYETLTYDALGRVTSSANVEGTSTKAYEDWWVTEVDANGETKLYYYDAFGRLTTVGERVGTSTTYVTSYLWTTSGLLAKITDGASNIRQFSYDSLGRRTVARDLRSSTDTAYGMWNYTFDNSSNLATSLSPLGVTTTYVYDDANRVTSENITSTAATDVTYVYDTCTNGVGRVCTVTVNGGATTAYVYDALGRVSSETKTISSTTYTTSYTYDRQGGITSVTYPDGSQTSYAFDDAGQVDEVVFDDGGSPVTVASGITYAPTGKVSSVTYGNGVETTYTYDATDLYRLTDLVTMSGTSAIEDFSYTFDNIGNLTNLVDASSLYAGMTVAYTYDDLYRLTQAASTSTDSALTYTKNWTYGAVGNILTSTDHGTYQYLGYQAGNYANPHAVTKIGTTTLAYDRNGNMTSDGTWTNAWNWRNQLTQSTSGTTTVTYTYDHDGNRVSQSSTTGNNLVYPNSYYTVDGTDVLRHVMLGSLGSIATSTDDGTASELVYHHKDHLGGTHVETDESGAVLEYIIYKPFGGTLVDSTTGSYSNDRKYTGKEKDSDTGYYYYGARYYMSDYGRFVSQDPVYLGTGTGSLQFLGDPQSLNSYSYSRNNPINFYDPDGQWGEWVWKFVAATEKFFNLGTAVVPFVSDIRDFVEVVTGRDAITNQPLTKDQHELTTAVMFAPILSGGVARKADDLLGGALSGMGKVTRYSTALDNVSVISKGKLIYQGSRDLTSVVDDILGGSRHGDGMYRNSNGVLPTQEAGYYQKYYLNTPEMSGGVTGPERIVTGKKGEVYYTPDHYDSFTQIK